MIPATAVTTSISPEHRKVQKMTRLKTLAMIAAVAVFGAVTPAQAHPHHMAEEEVMSFLHNGSTLTVWNTHQRGILGNELIEVRDAAGNTEGSWWSITGWCFTAHAVNNHPCWHPNGYIALIKDRLRGPVTVTTRAYSGSAASPSTDFCDHYTQLEYTVSGDTSGACGHEDGLALPSWAED